MTKKIDKNEFYFSSFNKRIGEYIKDIVNIQARDFIDTRETVVNETTIFMIKKGENKAEFEIDYNLRNIKNYLLYCNVDAVIKEIDRTIITEILGNTFWIKGRKPL